jgi:segregation and condensation protein A
VDVEHPPTTAQPFAIETEVYLGPLDLLIDLIERRKLLVNDISLVSVTDDYMRYVAALEQNPLRDMAEFIVLAATLLLIKSRSLLPVLELTETEEENIENLEERLRHYQIYRSAGKLIESLFGKQVSFERRYVPDREPIFMPDKFTTVDALERAIGDVLANLPKKPEKPKVQVRKVVSLEEMVERLRERFERQFSFTFRELTSGGGERTTVIVGFLAVLEMVKQGSILVKQGARCEEIQIEREGGSGVPRYFQ